MTCCRWVCCSIHLVYHWNQLQCFGFFMQILGPRLNWRLPGSRKRTEATKCYGIWLVTQSHLKDKCESTINCSIIFAKCLMTNSIPLNGLSPTPNLNHISILKSKYLQIIINPKFHPYVTLLYLIKNHHISSKPLQNLLGWKFPHERSLYWPPPAKLHSLKDASR